MTGTRGVATAMLAGSKTSQRKSRQGGRWNFECSSEAAALLSALALLPQTKRLGAAPLTQDIDSGVGFRTDPVVWVSHTGNPHFSVWVSRTGFGVDFPHRLLNLFLLAQCPNLTASGFLFARAVAAICLASSMDFIRRHS